MGIIIGRSQEFENVRINGDTVDERFGTVYRSMYSLFELMTLEGWDQVARPLVTKQPAIFLFIASFIMIFTFGLMNMIVAVVVEKTLEQARQMSEFEKAESRKKMHEELVRITNSFMDSDINNDGCLTLEEFRSMLQDSECIRKLLLSMDIRDSEVEDLFRFLECDGDGKVTIQEFCHGLAKLQAGAASVWDTLDTRAGVRSLSMQMSTLEMRLENEMRRHDSKLDGVLDVLSGLQETVRRIALKLEPGTNREGFLR